MPPLLLFLDAGALPMESKNNNKKEVIRSGTVATGSDLKSECLYSSVDLGSTPDAEKCNAGRSKKLNRRRSKSMSLPGQGPPVEQCKNNPLFYKSSQEQQTDDDQEAAAAAAASDDEMVFHRAPRGPLSLITSLISCWNQHKSAADRHRSKAWEKRRASALVELNKRQQAALVDKQDTIDMLEWQLEQLQFMASREHELQEMESSANLTPSVSPPPRSAQIQQQQQQDQIQIQDSLPREISATVLLFEMAVIRARLSIRYFCNVFIKQMEVSGYPVCRTLAEMEASSAFVRKEHTAFVLDSRINKAFFHSFENDSFDDSGVMKILDTTKRCAARLEEYKRMKLLNVGEAVNSSSSGFEPDFLRFCQSKTKVMWSLFQMISLVFKSVEEREAFTTAFLDVAKGVWLLHRLAFSMNPAVVIVRVGKGMEMNPLYVEAVAGAEEACRSCKSAAKVEFMIMPGFRAHNKIIKCQVYPHVHCR